MVGQPADGILHSAEAGSFDLIAIGATGQSDPQGSGLVGVAHRLAQESPVPVIMIH